MVKGCRSFAAIKHRLKRSPVLHLPNSKGRFTYIQTQVNLLWEAHYIKYKMENQN